MKLELKHIAPYLPYKLKFHQGWSFERGIEITLIELDIHGMANFSNLNGLWDVRDLRPILRPLSDLTKEIEVNGEKFVPIDDLSKEFLCPFYKFGEHETGWVGFVDTSFGSTKNNMPIYMDNEIMGECPCFIYQKLIEWNFDVFGLIDAGLAIDINTLK
jgi:hypothetical protein